MECPKCGEQLSAAAFVPDEQTLTMRLESESDFFDAQGIGDVLQALAKSMRAIASELDAKVAVFIKDIRVKPKCIEIEVIIAGEKAKEVAAYENEPGEPGERG